MKNLLPIGIIFIFIGYLIYAGHLLVSCGTAYYNTTDYPNHLAGQCSIKVIGPIYRRN